MTQKPQKQQKPQKPQPHSRIHPLNHEPNTNNNIQVYIRIRPYSQSQPQQHSCVEVLNQKQISINTKQPGQVPSFIFDRIFESKSKQQQIYRQISSDIINNAFIGINGTIFCYGQTSSGKTYTCIGKDININTSTRDININTSTKDNNINTRDNNKQNIGILPRMIEQILQRISTAPKHIEYKMKISMLQIYNQKIKDLLDIHKHDLKIRSDKSRGIFIQNITQKYLLSKQQAYTYMIKGIQNRSVGITQMNAVSSRSHMLFIITIHQQDLYTGQATVAKITLVDLAGSQKISRTGVQGKLLEQAKKINTSLSALGKVINILSQGKSTHIPYRDSKLTRLLQESLGGNSLTKLIINISPSVTNQHQTLSSLRFGFRAKSIKNQPRINREYTVPELLELLNKAEKKIKLLTDVIKEIMREKGMQDVVSFKEFVRQYVGVMNNQQNGGVVGGGGVGVGVGIGGYVSDQSDQAPLSLIKSISPTKITGHVKGKSQLNKSRNNNNNNNKNMKNNKDKDIKQKDKLSINLKLKQKNSKLSNPNINTNPNTNNKKDKITQKYNPQLQQFYSPQRQPISQIKAGSGELSLVNLFKSIDFDLKKKQDQIFSARQIKHTRNKSFNTNTHTHTHTHTHAHTNINVINDAKSNIDFDTKIKTKIKIKDEQSDKQSLLLQEEQQKYKQHHTLNQNNLENNNKQQFLLQDFQYNYNQQSNSQSQQQSRQQSQYQYQNDHQNEHQHQNEHENYYKNSNNNIELSCINSPQYGRSFIGSSCTFNSKILDISIGAAMKPIKVHQFNYHHNFNNNDNKSEYSNNFRISSSTVNLNLNLNLNQSVIPQSSSFFNSDTIEFNIAEIRNNLRKLKCMQKKRSMPVPVQ